MLFLYVLYLEGFINHNILILKKTLLLVAVCSFCFFRGNGQVITTIAGTGLGGNTGDGGPAVLAQIGQADAVATDNFGNIYFSSIQGSNSRVRKIDAAGIITTIAGNGTAGFSGDGGPATNAQIHGPQGIAVDGAGNVYFADAVNHRLRKIDTAGIITTIAGTGINVNTGDGGPSSAAGIGRPSYIAIDVSGNILFSSNYVVRKISSAGNISTFAGTGVGGYSGDGGPATVAEIRVLGIAIDAIGKLFLSDSNVVRKVDTTGTINTIAGNGSTGFSGDGGPATNAQLDFAVGLAADNDGNIFVCEQWGMRIRKVSSIGIITTIAGGGTCAPYEAGDGRPATDACLGRPRDVKVDNAGNIFIADGVNFRIRKIAEVTGVSTILNAGPSHSVYPNPSRGTFTVNISSRTEDSLHVFIANVVGRLIKEMDVVTNNDIEITLNQPPGVYVLSATTRDNKWIEKILISP